MIGPHETATATPVPLPRAQPSRAALVSTPPRKRGALTLGSSAGYGIVSAAGLNAWRRQPKRSTRPSGSATSEGSKKRKMGLGMGYEGTPGRRVTKRPSRTSKASIGAQSTPKARTSYSRPGDPSSTPSTMLDLDSSLTDPDSQQKERDVDFAVGATTISTVGHDVFGLTIAIDPDGTTREISTETIRAHSSFSYGATPSPASEDDTHDPQASVVGSRLGRVSGPPGGGLASSGWPFDHWDQDAYEHWKIQDQEDAEMETLMVPVDFGDSSSVDIPEDLAIAEEKEDRCVAGLASTTVLHDPDTEPGPTAFSPDLHVDDFTYDDDFMTMLDQTVVVPLNDHSDSSSGPLGEENDSSRIRKRQSRDKIASRQKTPRPGNTHARVPLVSYTSSSPSSDPAASPEAGRGLKLSVLSRADPPMCTERLGCFSEPDQDSSSSSPLSSPPDGSSGIAEHDLISLDGEIEDVEPADRLSAVPQHTVPAFSDHILLDLIPGSVESPGISEDPFGLIKVEKLAKGYKPARYRASSELASSPPPSAGRTSPRQSGFTEQSPLSASPSVSTSPSSAQGYMAGETHKGEPDQSVTDEQKGTDSWRGLWKGGLRSTSVKKAKVSASRPEDLSEKSIVHFIQPRYQGAAREARDARIAHYKDLAENYTLHIKSVQF